MSGIGIQGAKIIELKFHDLEFKAEKDKLEQQLNGLIVQEKAINTEPSRDYLYYYN